MKFTILFSVLAAASATSTGPKHSKFRGSPFSTNSNTNSDINRRSVQQPWGGAVQEGQGRYHATGTVTVPSVTDQPPSAGAAAWVGIDGYSDGSLETWYKWWPALSSNYNNPISVSAGDQLRITVYAWSSTFGNSTIENLFIGEVETHEFYNQPALCNSDAEWIVEDFYNSNGHVQLADFGSVAFRDTEAYGSNGGVNATGANIVDITVDGQRKTSCGSNANGVPCNYVR